MRETPAVVGQVRGEKAWRRAGDDEEAGAARRRPPGVSRLLDLPERPRPSVGKSKANRGPPYCASPTHRPARRAPHRVLRWLRRARYRPRAGARAEVRPGGPWPAFRFVRSRPRELVMRRPRYVTLRRPGPFGAGRCSSNRRTPARRARGDVAGLAEPREVPRHAPRIGDNREELHAPPARFAGEHVEPERALQKLGPRPVRPGTLRWSVLHLERRRGDGRRLGGDALSPATRRREHPRVPHRVEPRWRYAGSEPGEQRQRVHFHGKCPVSERTFQNDAHEAVWPQLDAFLRDGGTQDVPEKRLLARGVVAAGSRRRVQGSRRETHRAACRSRARAAAAEAVPAAMTGPRAAFGPRRRTPRGAPRHRRGPRRPGPSDRRASAEAFRGARQQMTTAGC
jgi:hypothetical protein